MVDILQLTLVGSTLTLRPHRIRCELRIYCHLTTSGFLIARSRLKLCSLCASVAKCLQVATEQGLIRRRYGEIVSSPPPPSTLTSAGFLDRIDAVL